MNRRILVTGATGFLGRHIVRELIENGDTVCAITRVGSDTARLPIQCARLMHDGSTEGLHAMVRDFGPDVVIHAATLFVAAHAPEDIELLIRANILFGTQLLDAMARANVRRLLNFGTSWQHFRSDEYRPATLYAATKQSFEDIAAYYADAKDFAILTLKLSDTYGPDDPRKKLIQLLMESAATDAELAMSPGEQRVSLLHTADLVSAVRVALSRLSTAGPGSESFAVRGEEILSLKALVAVIEQTLGKRLAVRWGARSYREREVMYPWEGPLLPGWQPRTRLTDGIRTLAKFS